MKVIGICGKLGSGKTTVQNYITDKYGYKKINFADPLKEVAKILGLTTRGDLQRLGDGFRQLFGGDFWIRILGKRLDKLCYELAHSSQKFVIGDVRYINEAQWILDKGGLVIGLEAGYYTRYERVYTRSNSMDRQPTINQFYVWSKDSSETGVDAIFLESNIIKIDNNGTIQELLAKVDDIFLNQKLF